jgi:GntR family transcriptional regulator
MFVINPQSPVPVYRQIVDQVRDIVRAGGLKPGDQLPTLRDLAQRLGINPLTISKAYDILADEGLLVKEHGRGVFITEAASASAQKSGELEQRLELQNLLRRMLASGIPPSRLYRLFAEEMEKLQ